MQPSIGGKPLFCAKRNKPVEIPAPLAPLADTHGHLTSFRKLESAQAIARAALVGVRLLVVPVDPSDDVLDVPQFLGWFDRTIEDAARLLAENEELVAQAVPAPELQDPTMLMDNVYFVAGVHPYGAQRLEEDAQARMRLEQLLGNGRCKGVGEFGLDYGPWNELPAQVQEQAVRTQLRLAHERGLPVELHLRDGEQNTLAHDGALRLLEEEGVPEAGCDLHCFTSGPEVMEPFVQMGCSIAFGGAATFARSDNIRAAVATCPEERLLSETDSPYMAPVPLRGQEFEPAMVALSIARIAEERERERAVPQAQTYAALWRNAVSFFGIGL